MWWSSTLEKCQAVTGVQVRFLSPPLIMGQWQMLVDALGCGPGRREFNSRLSLMEASLNPVEHSPAKGARGNTLAGSNPAASAKGL